MSDRYDVVVIGAGFGGLSTALRLSEQGRSVLVLERVSYPGGCAATYRREQHRFEAGATLFAGFEEGGVLAKLISDHHLPVVIDPLSPVLEFRTPSFSVEIDADRHKTFESWRQLPNAPVKELAKFFRFQSRMADRLWPILENPHLLNPSTLGHFSRSVARATQLLPLLPWVGRPMTDLLRHFRLEDFEPLRQFLDSQCQITIQCGVREAETAFALGAIDYLHRGAAHVRGGIGSLADALVSRIEQLGGRVYFNRAAKQVTQTNRGWLVTDRAESYQADAVVANLLPSALSRLLELPSGSHSQLEGSTPERGWSACMLYRSLDATGLSSKPAHLQLRAKGPGEAIEGHHVFCSLSGEADGERTPNSDERTVTMSTHVPLADLQRRTTPERAEYITRVQQRMEATVEQLVPEWRGRFNRTWTASPRTFQRYTGRPNGWVGGHPRRAGLSNYRKLGPQRIFPGLWIVGDSGFLGASVLGTTVSGFCTADTILNS